MTPQDFIKEFGIHKSLESYENFPESTELRKCVDIWRHNSVEYLA